MQDNNQLQPQYIYVQQPEYDSYDDEDEIDFWELFSAIWKRKIFIFIASMIMGVVGLAYAFYLPLIYKAECRILPQTSGGSSGRLASLASQYGGLASLVGVNLPGKSTAAGTMIAVMKSDTIVDTITDRFNLMEEYKQEYRLHAREAVLENFDAKEEIDSGIITVSFMDEDPQKAADITNAFVQETQKKMMEIAVNNAQQSRSFYENQLMQAQQELTEAEEAMLKYQVSSGVISLSEQAKALINAIASLRTQIAAKNVEITELRSYTTANNPMLKSAISQLEGMQRELNKLEEEQKRNDSGRNSRKMSGDVMLSVGEFPELGLEYQRYERALKIAGSKYQLMFQQYESARLAEMDDMSTIAIIDPAMPPDYKFKPSRAKIVIIWAFMGGFLATAKAAYPNLKKQILADKRKKDYDDDEDDD